MKLAYYNWQCDSCGENIEVRRPVADYEIPPLTEEVLGIDTPCSHVWRRTISVVSFLSTERHVGRNEFAQDRTRQELIEASKVEKEMFTLPHDKRGEHKKQIKRLKSTNPNKEE